MNLMQAAVLGIVQGLTEFLPISSSGHLRVVPELLGFPDPGTAYTAVIQLGSVVAVISYFFSDLWNLARGGLADLKARQYDSHNLRIIAGILLGTLPICIFGLLFKHAIEGPLRSLAVVGISSIVMAILLGITERLARHTRTMENLGVLDGLIVGLGQCLALIPGSSRSGSTLTFALFRDLRREDAARFSFLLGIPAILLSGLLELKEMLETKIGEAGIANLACGLIVSLIVSYLSIAWLMRYLKKHSTWVFVIYRLLFGALVLYMYYHGHNS
jgi:undecaprenyl-diphosphatase